MFIVALILSLILAAAAAGAGVSKLTGQKAMKDSAAHFGIAWERYRLIGVLEVAAAVGLVIGLFWAPLGIAAAVGFALLMIGAVVTHVRAGDKPPMFAPAAGLAILAIVVVIVRSASA